MREKRLSWALPGIVFASAFAMSAACGSQGPGDIGSAECPKDNGTTGVTTTGAGTTGAGGTTTTTTTTTTSATTSTGSGMMQQAYDPPSAEEIASRLHSCHKLPFNVLATMLQRRGVAMVTVPTTPLFTTAAQANTYDGKNTPVMSFGQSTTLGKLLGGSNAACELGTNIAGNGPGNCTAGEVCFCNQDDKRGGDPNNTIPTTCIDSINNGSPVDAPDGYCVAKPATSMYLFLSGKEMWGVPKLDSRTGESDEHTTASAMRLMDIFVQAAPQIIANIGDPVKAPACTVGGVNKPMFDPADGSCNADAVSCLIGQPASDDHLLLCNLILQKANPVDQADVDKKRRLAVAALLSAAHSCE
jgi:hypothetical protein